MVYIAKIYFYGVTLEIPCSTLPQAKRVVLQNRKADITAFVKGQVISPMGSVEFKIGA